MIPDLLTAVGPVFAVVMAAWTCARLFAPPERWVAAVQRATFDVLVPVLLFHTMAHVPVREQFDASLLLAYYLPTFALYALVYGIARARGRDARRANVLGLGACYGNAVLLGVPLVLRSHGDAAAVPLFAIVGVHAATLFFTTSLLHELAADALHLRALLRDTAKRLLGNPILIGIAAGAAVSLSGLALPAPLEMATGAVRSVAPWAALLAMGLGLARYRLTGADSALDLADAGLLLLAKLLLHPLLVAGACALSLGLHDLRAQVLVTLAALPTGINVYLFAVRFRAGEAASAAAILVGTALSAASVALVLLVLAHA